jgi:hypothetical protein
MAKIPTPKCLLANRTVSPDLELVHHFLLASLYLFLPLSFSLFFCRWPDRYKTRLHADISNFLSLRARLNSPLPSYIDRSNMRTTSRSTVRTRTCKHTHKLVSKRQRTHISPLPSSLPPLSSLLLTLPTCLRALTLCE